MAGTVLDEFVLQFSLDPTKFTAGQRALMQSLNEMTERARKAGNEVDAQSKRIVETFADIKRTALGVVGLLLGGFGAKELIDNVANLDAMTGRMARTMDMSATELSKWQGAAIQMGGTAEGMTGTLQGLSSEVNKFALTGQTGLLGPLTSLGVNLYNANNQLKTSTELFLDVADAVQGMDPARARAFLSLLGMDQNAVNIALLGRHAIQGYLDAAEKAGVTTKESAQAAFEYQRNMGLLEIAARNVGRQIMGDTAPALEIFLVTLRHLLDPEPWGHVFSAFTKVFKDFMATPVPEGGLLGSLGKLMDTPVPSLPFQFGGGRGGGAKGGGWPGGPSAAQREANIRKISSELGLDPDQMMALARAEGFHDFMGDFGTSFGDFQLHYGGGGLAGVAAKQGINASDPSQAMAADRFALEWIKAHGVGDFHGARNVPGLGAPAAAAARHSSNVNNSRSNVNQSSVHVGEVNVTVHEGDGDKISGGIREQLRRSASLGSWNSGLA